MGPRSLPQAHRWFLCKVHLNAPLAASRVAPARPHTAIGPCFFCGGFQDSIEHITKCQAVMSTYDDVCLVSGLPPLTDGRPTLFLQTEVDGATVAGVIAVFSSVWSVRAMRRRGVAIDGRDSLTSLVMHALQCPWLLGCCPSRNRKERRTDRVRDPTATPGAVIYRSDGASRGQGHLDEPVAGWGAAVWQASPDGRATGAPAATARGFLGNATNNVAEYMGVHACMERALRVADPHVVFQVDSMLLARQLAQLNPWVCRSVSLQPLHRQCVDIGEQLTRLNVVWGVQHVYREFNQTADALSNQAIDERDTNGPSAFW